MTAKSVMIFVDRVATICDGLQRLLDVGAPGRRDAPRVAGLRDLFRSAAQPRVPLSAVLKLLFPDKEETDAAAHYRGFKGRLNDHFTEAAVNLSICNEPDNRPIPEKRVWFEQARSQEELDADKAKHDVGELTRQMFLREKTFFPDTLADHYVPQRVSFDLPMVKYPKTLEPFAQRFAPDRWQALDEDRRTFLAHLGTRFVPFVEIRDQRLGTRVVAFQLLPLGPQGQHREDIAERAGDCDPGLIDFLLALAALRTALALRADRQEDGKERPLIFRIPLTFAMLDSPYLEPFLEATQRLRGEHVLFQMTEPPTGARLALLRRLHDGAGLRWTADAVPTAVASVGSSWTGWLEDVSPWNAAGGYVLASPLLAEVTRVVLDSLPASTPDTWQRQKLGPVYRLTLPANQKVGISTHTLDIVCERVPPEAVRPSGDSAFAIVADRGPRVSGQFTAEDVPSLLHTFREMPRAARALVPRDERYPEDKFEDSSVKTTRDLAKPDVARELFEEGRQALLRWLEEPGVPFCAVLGDYGVGKTFLCRMFARRMLERYDEDRSRPVPLYVDMRDVAALVEGRVPMAREMLEEALRKREIQGLSIDGLMTAARHGEVVLIFDGLDEKIVHLDKEQSTALLRNLRGALSPEDRHRAKVLLACRTHYFLDHPDERTRLRGGAASGTRDGFDVGDFRFVFLDGFDEERIRHYLAREIGAEAVEGTMTFLGRVHNLLDLARRPFLLVLIVRQLEALRARQDAGGRVGAADVYEGAVQEWLERDDETHKHQFLPDVKVAFMEEVAWRMWAHRDDPASETKPWHHTQLSTWLKDQELPSPLRGARDAAWRAEVDVRTATFLVRDDDGNYRFAHTSFQEFFLARRIARLLANGEVNGLDLPRLNREVCEFVVDLVHGEKYDPGRAAHTLRAILETAYVERRSENALLLVLAWQRLRPSTAPRPERYHLDRANLSGLDLCGVTLLGVEMRRANLRDALLCGARLQGNLAGADLTRVQAAGADLSGSVLREATLDAADLASAILKGCDLTEAWGVAVFLQRADLTDAVLTGAQLTAARLAGAIVSGKQLDKARLTVPSPTGTGPADVRLVAEGAHTGAINAVAFSPDGRLMASASDDTTIKIWEWPTGRLLHTLAGHTSLVLSVAFDPHGRVLASGSADATVRLWDAATGQTQRTLAGHTGGVSSVAFDPHGRVLASGSSDTTVRLWDAATGQTQRTLAGHTGLVLSVAFDPHGRVLASGSSDTTVRLWDAATGQTQRTLAGHTGWVRSVAFDPHGRVLASGSSDTTVRLWDAATGQTQRTLAGHTGWVRSVAFDPHGRVLASGSSDTTVRLWDAATGQTQRTLAGHTGWVSSVAFDPHGRVLASGSSDTTVRLWDAATGQTQRTLAGHTGLVRSVAFDPHGRVLASGSSDTTVRLWDAATGQTQRTLAGHTGLVLSVAFDPHGRVLASGSSDTTVRLWDAATGQTQRTLAGHTGWVRSVAFDPHGRVLASGSSDTTVRLWDAATGQTQRTLAGHTGWVRSVAFDPHGRVLASGSSDTTVRLWDAATGQTQRTLAGHTGWVRSVAFDPHGRVLASGSSDTTVRLWDAATGQTQRTLAGHTGWVLSVAFDPHGRVLASGSHDGTIRFWDPVTGKCQAALEGQAGPIAGIVFTASGRVLASAHWTGAVCLWDVASTALLATLKAEGSGRWVTYTPDGLFNCSEAMMPLIGYRHETVVYPAAEWAEHFRKPKEIARRLKVALGEEV